MNKNINNHNGKAVHRDPIRKNVKKEGDTQPVDRVRKKNPGNKKEIQSGESKKAPITVHKNPNFTNQKAPNAQAVEFGNMDSKENQADSAERKNQNQVENPPQTSTNGKSFTKQAPSYNTTADNNQDYSPNTVNPKYSSNTGTYLYLVAAILFIAWVISFFFYKLGANTHMLLALAIIVGIISFLQGRKK